MNDKNKKQIPNQLIHESSPYLIQHAYNPVEWYAWNDETLARAKKEDKMLLISVGYAACHWCHVMAHESFEDEAAAAIMNTHFICVKVDREERPDVDQVYMDAAYLINGNGGWPLNALALPDGRPFFAGTYFRTPDWIRLLEYFANIYKTEKKQLIEQAETITKGIHEIDKTPSLTALEDAPKFNRSEMDTMWKTIIKQCDLAEGGLRSNNKFPMPSVWIWLQQYAMLADNENARQIWERTLFKMAAGGIYDQVGGGFSRYATDTRWHVPHFEKMLYDNAQLVSGPRRRGDLQRDEVSTGTSHDDPRFGDWQTLGRQEIDHII